MAVLGLPCYTWPFSSCSEWGLAILQLWWVGFSVWCLLFLWSMGSKAPGLQQLQYVGSVVPGGFQGAGSVAMAHRLSCFMAHGILPYQGSNPCPGLIGRWNLNHWITREVPNILLTEQLGLVWPRGRIGCDWTVR